MVDWRNYVVFLFIQDMHCFLEGLPSKLAMSEKLIKRLNSVNFRSLKIYPFQVMPRTWLAKYSYQILQRDQLCSRFCNILLWLQIKSQKLCQYLFYLPNFLEIFLNNILVLIKAWLQAKIPAALKPFSVMKISCKKLNLSKESANDYLWELQLGFVEICYRKISKDRTIKERRAH